MSAKKTIFVLCIVLYSVHRASSLKCYTCDSPLTEECYKNPKQQKFEGTCPTADGTTTTTAPKPANFLNHPMLSALAEDSAADADATETHNCLTMVRSMGSVKVVSRSCTLKSLTDEDIKKAAIAAGMTVDFLIRCETDLCNSSDSPTEPTTTSPAGTTPTKAPVPPSSTTPSPSSSKAPAPSTTKAPSPSTTSAPDSSSSLAIEFWCLASSLLLIFYFKL